MNRTVLFILLSFICLSSAAEGPATLVSAQEAVPLPLEGRFTAPCVSPSGKFLAFTGENFKGIWLFSLEDGKVRQLTGLDGSGFGYAWKGDEDLLAFRGSVGSGKRKHLLCVGHADGTVEVSTPLLEKVSLPSWTNGFLTFAAWDMKPVFRFSGPAREASSTVKALFCSPEGRVLTADADGREEDLSGTEGRVFFLPRVSDDGKNFIVHCVDGWIYAGSQGGRGLRRITPGSEARLVRGGSAIVFERTTDDGHRITGSELFLFDLDKGEETRLTDSPSFIERRPSMAPDGHTLFWDQDGTLMRGWVK